MRETEKALPAATDCLPEAAEQNAKAVTQIEASNVGDHMKRALRRVASGESFREAAQAEGYKTHSDVYRYARQYGLLNVKDELLIDGCRRVSGMGLAELERRLAEDPEGFSVKELGVTTGILLDKIAKKERWGLEPKEGAGALDVLERLADRVAKGELELELRVSRPDPADRAIDVTPEPEPAHSR